MLCGWESLRNGPLVPQGVTKVTTPGFNLRLAEITNHEGHESHVCTRSTVESSWRFMLAESRYQQGIPGACPPLIVQTFSTLSRKCFAKA